jgi:hypothetical protein
MPQSVGVLCRFLQGMQACAFTTVAVPSLLRLLRPSAVNRAHRRCLVVFTLAMLALHQVTQWQPKWRRWTRLRSCRCGGCSFHCSSDLLFASQHHPLSYVTYLICCLLSALQHHPLSFAPRLICCVPFAPQHHPMSSSSIHRLICCLRCPPTPPPDETCCCAARLAC